MTGALRALAAGLLVVAFAMPARAQELTVFAAASLKTALDAVAADYTDQSGTRLRLSYAGSSALARQIQQGAPAHLFLSANPGWMDVVQNDGLLVEGTRRDLLTNSLVMIAAAGVRDVPPLASGPDLGPALLEALNRGRLAMALVSAVPAGIYGKAALRHLGIWDLVQPHVAQSDNVRAALRLVALGEAPLGIVYATDALAEPRVRIVGTFPPESHPPIVYPVAILAEADTAEARDFLTYLTSDTARDQFRAFGFGLAGGHP